MELMGDIGLADQLTSVREENKVLRAKVKELTEKVEDLTLTNAQLLAEVEMYRHENSLPTFSQLALGGNSTWMTNNHKDNATINNGIEDDNVHFISSGDGIFASEVAASFPGVHGLSTNPLCCALDKTDTILATGGADGYVCIMRWGTALVPGENSVHKAIQDAARVRCTAPVICIGFSTKNGCNLLAAGCMDGNVHLIAYKVASCGQMSGWILDVVEGGDRIKFGKYVKCLAFAPESNMLASASADGTILLTNISTVARGGKGGVSDEDGNGDYSLMMVESDDSVTNDAIIVEQIKSVHVKGGVEALCFVNQGNTLCFYERDTSYLAYLDVMSDLKITKHSLNGDVTGGFDNHVSFAIMHLVLSPNGKYICAATDTSRNIIIQVQTSNIVRNLYGHKNDIYSQPRIAWSSNGQYIFGNTQEDNSICVWDIASGKMVRKVEGHNGQIRDIFSSKSIDTVVTVSYDKSIKIWLSPI